LPKINPVVSTKMKSFGHRDYVIERNTGEFALLWLLAGDIPARLCATGRIDFDFAPSKAAKLLF
jgi:hypothetical protein